MWILRYLECLIHGHGLVDIVCQGVNRGHHYHYCPRCGRLTPVTQSVEDTHEA